MTSRIWVLLACTACASEPASREQRVIDALAEDNYAWLAREPALVRHKLVKMQRGPYPWMRGTALLYWRDLTEPGGDRLATAFGSPGAARVLLVADPHPENVGTFRAADGTMFVDWNDFDGSGYGPFTGDVRRLVAGLVIAAQQPALDDALARRVAAGYAAQIAALARGERAGALGVGRHPLLDDELAKALERGDRKQMLDEVAPVDAASGARAIAFGDLEAVADDGVIEDRLEPAGAEAAVWIERAIASWRADATIKLMARRIGSGVASYPALRYNVVLEGESAAPDDDLLVELKETRDGTIIRGVPQRGEWEHPAARAVDTQRRLHARPDGDALLGAARVGGLSLKVRDREAYQRGLDAEDLAELAQSSPEELLALAELLGGLLARAHGNARTFDGVLGWQVIAPLLDGRAEPFATELAGVALADAARTVADHAALVDVDLFAAIATAEVLR